MEIYKHTQVGKLPLLALGLALAVTGALFMAIPPARVIAGAVFIILTITILLFSTLTVQVSPQAVEVWFGPGLIRKHVRIEDLRDAHIVRNPWYYGWGIRMIPQGWMFNVSGMDAVELKRANGRLFRIGTDEPKQLCRAVQQAMKRSGG